jgi:hypothetical protein
MFHFQLFILHLSFEIARNHAARGDVRRQM